MRSLATPDTDLSLFLPSTGPVADARGEGGKGVWEKIGGAEEDRTPDLRIANATLSQLSYGPVNENSL